MRFAALLLLVLAGCAGDAPAPREGWRHASGPTVSVSGSVGGFAGAVR
jgi:hypothetical protein